MLPAQVVVKNIIGKFANVVSLVLSQWVHDFCDHNWLTKDLIKSVTCSVVGKSTSNEVFSRSQTCFHLVYLYLTRPYSLCCEKACRHSSARTHLLLYHFKSLKSSWGSPPPRAHWFPCQEGCSTGQSEIRNNVQAWTPQGKHYCGMWNHVGFLLSGENSF